MILSMQGVLGSGGHSGYGSESGHDRKGGVVGAVARVCPRFLATLNLGQSWVWPIEVPWAAVWQGGQAGGRFGGGHVPTAARPLRRLVEVLQRDCVQYTRLQLEVGPLPICQPRWINSG